MLTATFLALSALPAALKIEVQAGIPWLVAGKERFGLPREYGGNWQEKVWTSGLRLGGGDLLTAGWDRGIPNMEIRVSRGSLLLGKIPFPKAGEAWYNDESLWTEKKWKDIKWSAGTGFHPVDFLVLPGKENSALGTASIHHGSASGRPAILQVLYRIDATDGVKVSFVADLGLVFDSKAVWTPPLPMMFNHKGKTWVIQETLIRPYVDGKLGRAVSSLPSGDIPLGQVGSQGLLIGNSEKMEVRIWAPGSPNKKVYKVPEKSFLVWDAFASPDTELVAFGDEVLNPRTGKKVKLPWTSNKHGRIIIWKERAILADGNTVQVFNGKTGKKEATLKMPKAK